MREIEISSFLPQHHRTHDAFVQLSRSHESAGKGGSKRCESQQILLARWQGSLQGSQGWEDVSELQGADCAMDWTLLALLAGQ
jgi:hypothetical protein